MPFMHCTRKIAILAALGLWALLPAAPAVRAAEPPETTYLIPVEGTVENALLYVIRRGINQARQEKAGAIVLVMDTPGGKLGAAEEIVRLLLAVKVPTYTFVKGHAFSAGAIIALATDHIYMAPGSVIGDAMPIMLTPFGGVQDMPEALQEKAVSGVSALIRSAAQQKGHNPQLAEAMVRRQLGFKIDDKVIAAPGQLLTLTNVEAEQPVGAEKKPLLSEGTVKDIPALLGRIGRSASRQVELQVTAIERVARIIEAISFILLACGLLGLYLEFKTPGFGLPGILGILCLAIFFWGHHIAGLAGMEDLLLFFVGVTLILLEIFFFPGFGLIGILGAILMIVAIFAAMLPQIPEWSWQILSFSRFQKPLLTLAGALALTGGVVYFLAPYLPKSKIFGELVLNDANSREKGFRSDTTAPDLVGLKGVALTPLRPAGTGIFGDQRLDVVTRGEFIEPQAPIRIVETHGMRIIVEEDEQG